MQNKENETKISEIKKQAINEKKKLNIKELIAIFGGKWNHAPRS